MVGAGAPHAAHLPGVEQLGLGHRHEHVARLRLALVEPHLAVLDDLRMRGDPRGIPAAGAEALAPGDPVAARYDDGLGVGLRRVGDHGARLVDPDRAGDVAGHPGRVGGEDRALVDHPAGAGVGLADLLDHLDVGRQVDLAAAHGTGKGQVEQAGVGHRVEERLCCVRLHVDVVGVRTDHGRELPGGFERR